MESLPAITSPPIQQIRYADQPAKLEPDCADAGSKFELYRAADLSAAGFVAEPERFYEVSYRSTLRRMVAHVVSTEGPIYDDLLVRRIARFHGFQRAGKQIKEAVLGAIERRFPQTTKGERLVIWPEGSSGSMLACRFGSSEARDHNEIPDKELQPLARAHLEAGASPQEAAALMAEELKIGRLRQVTRERFEAIARQVLRSS